MNKLEWNIKKILNPKEGRKGNIKETNNEMVDVKSNRLVIALKM